MERMTNQREIILEELRKVKCHPTADELYGIIKTRLPRISIATVYRNLELMAGSGMIRKLEFAGKQKRFDGDTKKHHHIRCIECGKLDDISVSPVKGIDDCIMDSGGYSVLGHRLDFFGICPECNKRKQDLSTNRKSIKIEKERRKTDNGM